MRVLNVNRVGIMSFPSEGLILGNFLGGVCVCVFEVSDNG